MKEMLTYGQLKARRFKGEEISQQQKNALSTLNRFMESFGATDDSHVGSEFAQEFEMCKERFTSAFQAKTTRYSQSYHLKEWYKFFHSLTPDPRRDTNGHSFQSFVLQRAASMNMDAFDICKAVKSRTVYNWLKYDQAPSKKSYAIIDAISVLLGFEASYLREAFFFIPEKNEKFVSAPETTYQIKLKRIKGTFKQITKAQWNGEEFVKMRQELALFYDFKTADILDDEVSRPSTEKWTVHKDGYSGSINTFEGTLKAYFGFLVQEKAIALKDLSIDHLFAKGLIVDYVKFQTKRHGATTISVHKFLANVRVLVKYFIEYPERIYPQLSKEDAISKLKDYYHYLGQRIKTLNIKIHARDPEEQLRPILNLQNPLAPIVEAISYMKKRYEHLCKRYPNYTLEIHELARNIVLMDLLIEKPIRAKNLAELTVGKTIIKSEDGRYQLCIPKEEVKNKKAIKKTLSAELSKWIDIYLENHHFSLCKTKTDRFIVSREFPHLTAATVGKTCGRICKKYIGIEMRTHAIRHIRATAYLLKHPQDYTYVAELLNDKLNVVIRVYSHLENRVPAEKDDNDLKELREEYLEK